MTEEQIAAIVSKAVTDALAQHNSAHEAEKQRLLAKNAELLSEKRKLQHQKDPADWQREREETVKEILADQRQKNTPDTSKFVALTKTEARVPAAYRAAKERAEKEGKQVRILDDNAPASATAERSRVKQFRMDNVLFVHKDQNRRISPVEMNRIAAAQGCRVHLFQTRDELPPLAARQHDMIAAANDPQHMLEGRE